MSRRILVAPNEVDPIKGDGYCFTVAPGDELFFPHVDTCFALAFALEGNWVIGGHVPEMWDKIHDPAFCFTKMTNLMKATCVNNINKQVTGLIGVGTQNWEKIFGEFYGKYDPLYMGEFPKLRIDTQRAKKGVNVLVKPTVNIINVVVEQCNTTVQKTFEMPKSDAETKDIQALWPGA